MPTLDPRRAYPLANRLSDRDAAGNTVVPQFEFGRPALPSFTLLPRG
jgi:hypothetical protein